MTSLVLDQVTESTSNSTSKPKGFRLNSSQIFLTYSQCEKSPDEILVFLNNLKIDIKNYIVAQEKHKDGNNHIHCYLLLNKKINIRNERYFDIDDYHPKVEGVRSWKNVIKYVTKDGNYITNYEQSVIDDIIKKNMKVGELYTKARELAIEGKPKEGLKVLEHDKTVRDLVIHGNAIQKNLRQLAVKRKRPDFNIEDFDIDFIWNRDKTLILWGPTNMGKTSLAKALLPDALLVGHKDKLKLYEEGEYNGIIYDDMSFLHWPREAQLHLVDYEQERDIDVKHSMVTIPAKTPKIMTTNKMPAEMILANDPAIARRIQVVFVDKRLSKMPRTIDELIDEVDNGDAFAWVRNRNRNRQSEFRSGEEEEEEVDLHQIQSGASSQAAGAGEGQP